MAMETVQRRWTIATWLVARGAEHVGEIAKALGPLRADAIALQSIRRDDAESIATALGDEAAWELSHYPRSPLFRSSGVGLAVISPHTFVRSGSSPIGDHRSTWSPKRRIVQSATIARADATVYTIVHRVGPLALSAGGQPDPYVLITPEQVGVDSSRAVVLPDDATLVSHQVTTPIDGLEPLQVTTFDMPWVKGDFPVV